MLIYIANLVFCGGVGMRIRNGRLIHLFQIYNSIDLRKIISVKLGPDGVFHDVPGTLIVKLAGGRQVYIPTLFYETPVPEMVARLEAHGVKVVASAS
jgi:hypothetical protein